MNQDESNQVEWLLYESVGGVVPNQQGTLERGSVSVPCAKGPVVSFRTLKQQTFATYQTEKNSCAAASDSIDNPQVRLMSGLPERIPSGSSARNGPQRDPE